jgi:hypothetical protein
LETAPVPEQEYDEQQDAPKNGDRHERRDCHQGERNRDHQQSGMRFHRAHGPMSGRVRIAHPIAREVGERRVELRVGARVESASDAVLELVHRQAPFGRRSAQAIDHPITVGV